MSYKDKVGARGSLDGSSGFMVKMPGTPHKTVMPSWQHESRYRFWPQPDDKGGFMPMRLSADANDFSGAIYAGNFARSLGVNEQFTYFTDIPGREGKDPTSFFVEALLSLIDEKPREVPEQWLQWPKGGPGRPAKLQRVKPAAAWQGMAVMSAGKMKINAVGQPAPDYPCLIVAPFSLKQSFEHYGNLRNEQYSGPMPDQLPADATRQQFDQLYAQLFVLGDWCSLEHGRIISVFQAPPSGQFDRPHYTLKAMEELPLTGIAQAIRQQLLPWNKLIRVHTVEEQVSYLCRAFPPEAVDYAFSSTEYADALPQHVRGRYSQYLGTQRAYAPGYGYQVPAGYGAPQPQAAPPAGYGAPPQQVPPAGYGAPQPQSAPPAAYDVSQPQQAARQAPPAAQQSVGGYDLSGGAASDASDAPIMSAFSAAPVAATASQSSQSAQPAQPAQPAQLAQPGQTTPVIDEQALNASLAKMRELRNKTAGGQS